MARLLSVDPQTATGAVGELLGDFAARGGDVGPMVRSMATSPALLRGYVELSRSLKRSRLDRRVTERISLAVQEWLGCDYCLAAHARAARSLGLSDTDIELARQGTATDPKVAAVVGFAQQVAAAPCEIGDDDVTRLKELGFTDGQIAEVVGLVALNQLTGSFNLVAGIHAAGRRSEGEPARAPGR